MKSQLGTRRELLSGAASVVLATRVVTCADPALGRPGNDESLATLRSLLSQQSSGRIVMPRDTEYPTIKYYNGRLDCVGTTNYIQPNSTRGVQIGVRWAYANMRPFAVRGCGHSFEGKSSHPDLVIDMSRMKRIALNRDGTLDVEGGVQLGEIYDRLSTVERILPAGTCPTVGVVGHILGGGIGDFLPMYGFAAQSLLEAELVTFTGQVLRVTDSRISGDGPLSDRSKAAELMKLLRGAGQGSIGIITRMKLMTYDVRQTNLAAFKLETTGDQSSRNAAAIIEAWFRWRSELPTALKSLVSAKLNLGRSGNSYSCNIAGLIAIPSTGSTTVADIQRTLEPLFSIRDLSRRSFTSRLNAASAIKSFVDDDETTNNPKRKMLYGSSSVLPSALPHGAIEYLLRNMSSSHFISIYTSGGRSRAAPETSLHASEFIVEWTTYSSRRDPGIQGSIRTLRMETIKRADFESQYADLGFPNYPDNERRNYFTNSNRIETLTRAYDPGNLSTSSLVATPSEPSTLGACR